MAGSVSLVAKIEVIAVCECPAEAVFSELMTSYPTSKDLWQWTNEECRKATDGHKELEEKACDCFCTRLLAEFSGEDGAQCAVCGRCRRSGRRQAIFRSLDRQVCGFFCSAAHNLPQKASLEWAHESEGIRLGFASDGYSETRQGSQAVHRCNIKAESTR